MYHICTHVYACSNKKLYYVTIFYENILSFKEVEQMISAYKRRNELTMRICCDRFT